VIFGTAVTPCASGLSAVALAKGIQAVADSRAPERVDRNQALIVLPKERRVPNRRRFSAVWRPSLLAGRSAVALAKEEGLPVSGKPCKNSSCFLPDVSNLS
jgi:hypothetical protein